MALDFATRIVRRLASAPARQRASLALHSAPRALGQELARLAGAAARQAPMFVVYGVVHMFYTRSYIELQRVDAVRPPGRV
jgi:hypothetical protein